MSMREEEWEGGRRMKSEAISRAQEQRGEGRDRMARREAPLNPGKE